MEEGDGVICLLLLWAIVMIDIVAAAFGWVARSSSSGSRVVNGIDCCDHP